MRMLLESNDIYDVQIDEIITGQSVRGCNDGYDDFEVDVDDVTQDGNIEIEISGKCRCFGYHDSMPCTFEGTLIMNDDDFTYAYTSAIEAGDKYINFDGSIEISSTSRQGIHLDADYVVDDTFEDTLDNIRNKIENEIVDGYSILCDVVKSIVIHAADKVVEEIKRIDNVDLDKDNEREYIYYVLENVLSGFSIKNAKYKSIDTILNAQAAEDIDKISNLIDDKLSDIANQDTETLKITAKVFFSDLDP